MKEKNTTGVWVAAAMLLLVGLTCAYVTAYFLRGQYLDMGNYAVRIYPSEFEEVHFRPAASIESAVTGRKVITNMWLSNEQ